MPLDKLLYPKRQPPRMLPAGQFELDRTHPLTAGLVAYWPLDGSTKNYVRSGRRATIFGSPTTAIGPLGPCVTLNGSTDYGSLGSNYAFVSVSYSIWVKLTSLANAYTQVMGYSDGVSIVMQLFVKSSGKLALYMGGPGSTNTAYDGTGSHTLSTNVWYHLALTYGPNQWFCGYVNGATDGVAVYASTAGSSTNLVFSIGNDLGTAGRLLAGQVANAMVYDRELSPREVALLYAEPYAMLCPVARRMYYAAQAVVATSTQARVMVMA